MIHLSLFYCAYFFLTLVSDYRSTVRYVLYFRIQLKFVNIIFLFYNIRTTYFHVIIFIELISKISALSFDKKWWKITFSEISLTSAKLIVDISLWDWILARSNFYGFGK